MNTRFLFLLLSLVAGLLFASPATTAAYPIADAPDANNFLLIENVGQFADGARFQAQAGGATLWLAQDALWLTLVDAAAPTSPEDNPAPTTGAHLRLSFPGANPDARLEPFDPAPTTISYFIGNDPDDWNPDVPVWRGARYIDLYPGIDLELTGADGQLLPRFVVRDANALAQVQLRVEGADGMALDAQGRLRLSTAVGEYTFPLFTVATPDGAPLVLPDNPIVDGDMLRAPFTFATAPQEQPAAPERAIVYSTFFGGTGPDPISEVATDSDGNIYLLGRTGSTDFPVTPGAYDPTASGFGDLFISKLNLESNALLYSTYFGSGHSDPSIGEDLVVDSNGNAYLTGSTMAYDFPTTPGAYDTTFGGVDDVFVTKLNPNGTALVYSTLIGAESEDVGRAIVLDGGGVAYIAGWTLSSYFFPVTPNALDPTHNGGSDFFVTLLNATGSDLIYSTFLGGASWDRANAIWRDSTGNLYLAGITSGDFPVTADAFDTTPNGSTDVIVAKIAAGGSALAYSTYLGGSYVDSAVALWVDAAGNSYITGDTDSANFPVTAGTYDTTMNGVTDVFVSKLNPTGSNLIYSTYLGGTDWELGKDITADGAGNAFISGSTASEDFPYTRGTARTPADYFPRAFASKLNSTGSSMMSGVVINASSTDRFTANLLLPSGQLLVVGETSSPDFPITPGAYDGTLGGSNDGIIVKLDLSALPTAVQVGTLRADSAAVPLGAFALALLVGVTLLVGRRREGERRAERSS